MIDSWFEIRKLGRCWWFLLVKIVSNMNLSVSVSHHRVQWLLTKWDEELTVYTDHEHSYNQNLDHDSALGADKAVQQLDLSYRSKQIRWRQLLLPIIKLMIKAWKSNSVYIIDTQHPKTTLCNISSRGKMSFHWMRFPKIVLPANKVAILRLQCIPRQAPVL